MVCVGEMLRKTVYIKNFINNVIPSLFMICACIFVERKAARKYPKILIGVMGL